MLLKKRLVEVDLFLILRLCEKTESAAKIATHPKPCSVFN